MDAIGPCLEAVARIAGEKKSGVVREAQWFQVLCQFQLSRSGRYQNTRRVASL
jgi:hypothetical protein